MEPPKPSPAKSSPDYGVTHGLDFARWITEIADLLKRTDRSDPAAQVCFMEIAKTLERVRRTKKDLIFGVFRDMLVVNETPITAFPISEIVAAPMVRLMQGAGLHSIGIDHKVDIRNVEWLAQMLAHPGESTQNPAKDGIRFVALNPVKYIVVFQGESPEKQELPPEGDLPPEMMSPSADTGLFRKEADVKGAVDDAFSGWSEDDDPLKSASRAMARKIEGVMPHLQRLAELDKKAPKEFLGGFFEKNFAEMSAGRSVDEVVEAMGTVLRALSPQIQSHIFGAQFHRVDREEIAGAFRATSPAFRTNFLLERMLAGQPNPEIRAAVDLLVGRGGEVAMVEHIARRLLEVDLTADTRAALQRLLATFGFDPSKSVRRRIVLYIGGESETYGEINRLLTRRGYGIILWDGHERPKGQELDADIVIMDEATSNESGRKLLEGIAKKRKKTPILVLSEGIGDPGPWEELGAGRLSVLLKPVPSDVLLSFFEDSRSGTRGSPSETPGKPMQESTSRLLKADLARARDIQERLIPREVPSVAGADIAIAYRPCSEVGGDYLDLFWVAPSQLAFSIADVSGKGISAAMVMIMVRSVFRAVTGGGLGPREVLIHVNRMLARDVKKGIFVSAIYGILDVEKHEILMANGGHNPPILWKRSTGKAELFPNSGMALGLTERAAFDNSIRETRHSLAVGDKLLLYTDGVTEAFDAKGGMYGDERLQEMFGSVAKKASNKALEAVMSDIDGFVGRAPRSDDITMLVIGRGGSTLDGV